MYISLVQKNISKRLSSTRGFTQPKYLAGFTLVELMVSLTIFSIVMLISTGTLLVLINVNAKAQALYSSTTNLSFALDSMTREMRTGYYYYCSSGGDLPNPDVKGNCTTSTNALIAFMRDKDAWQVGYRFNNGRIEQRINNPTSSTGDISWTPITSQDVTIETFSVAVANSASMTEEKQPTIDIHVTGKVTNGLDTDTKFNIQTHIVERKLDIF